MMYQFCIISTISKLDAGGVAPSMAGVRLVTML